MHFHRMFIKYIFISIVVFIVTQEMGLAWDVGAEDALVTGEGLKEDCTLERLCMRIVNWFKCS